MKPPTLALQEGITKRKPKYWKTTERAYFFTTLSFSCTILYLKYLNSKYILHNWHKICANSFWRWGSRLRVWTTCSAWMSLISQQLQTELSGCPRLALVIGRLTHSKRVLAESCYTVPHLILTATQWYQWHVTVTRIRQHAAHPRLLESVLRPHVAVIL